MLDEQAFMEMMANEAEMIGLKLAEVLSERRDELALQYGDKVANAIALNAVVNQLSFVASGIIAGQLDIPMRKFMDDKADEVLRKIHEAASGVMAEYLGRSSVFRFGGKS